MDGEAASSVLVSRTLDNLGYDQETLTFRQQVWEKFGISLSDTECNIIIAGSKGEGLTKLLENDTDYLIWCNFYLCTSRNPMLYNNKESLTVFRLDRTDTAPGYTRLICFKIGTYENGHPLFDDTLTSPIAGNVYLSNECHKKIREEIGDMRNDGIISLPPQGPSNPMSFPFLDMNMDLVLAIRCDCPELLQSWLNRPRRHDWPPANIIGEISNLEAHVVPVGFKGSQVQNLEWRICFTRAEIKLVKSLNDCQIKLIILLKMIAKNSLKPICKEMTSYVMKNIVFWVAELYPQGFFTEQNLLFSLRTALRFLRQCLVAKYIPSYMIPDRNLLAPALAHGDGSGRRAMTRLCTMIESLLYEGPCMLLRCDKIRNAWNMFYTAPATFYSIFYTSRQYEILAIIDIFYNDSEELNETVKEQLSGYRNQVDMSLSRILLNCEELLTEDELDEKCITIKKILLS